jgi:hypothetical protein
MSVQSTLPGNKKALAPPKPKKKSKHVVPENAPDIFSDIDPELADPIEDDDQEPIKKKVRVVAAEPQLELVEAMRCDEDFDQIELELELERQLQQKQQMVVLSAAVGDDTAVAVVPEPSSIDSMDSDPLTTEAFMQRFFVVADGLTPLMNKGQARTNIPDMALYLWCRSERRNLHAFELERTAVRFELNERLEREKQKQVKKPAESSESDSESDSSSSEDEDEKKKKSKKRKAEAKKSKSKKKKKEEAADDNDEKPFNGWSKTVLVERTEQKNDKNEKTGQAFINVFTKAPQRFLDGRLNQRQFHMVSPFFSPAFLTWGPTEQTGVNGTWKKVIRGNPVEAKFARYEFSVTNKSFHPLQQNEEYNNPVADHFMAQMHRMYDAVLLKACTNKDALLEMRKKIEKNNPKALRSPEALAATIKSNGLFKVVESEQQSDPSAKTLGMAVSVARMQGREYLGPKQFQDEDLSWYAPPSDMFRLPEMMHHRSGRVQVHRRIPLYRCRRPNEVQPGVTYSSPFVRVPFENARLTSKDIIAVVFNTGFYEWQFDVAGVTNKPVAFIWLNTRAALEAMNMDELQNQSCDPRYAVPCAGYYRGPLDEEAERAQQPRLHGTVDANDQDAVNFITN